MKYFLYTYCAIGLLIGSNIAGNDNKLRIVYIHGLGAFQKNEPLEQAVKRKYDKQALYKHIKFGNGTQLEAAQGIDKLAKIAYKQLIQDTIFYNQKKKQFLGPIVLFGNSQGGLVARTLLQKYLDPDRDSKVVDTCILTMSSLGGYYGLPDKEIYDSSVSCIAKTLLGYCSLNKKPAILKITKTILGTLGRCCYPCVSRCFYTPCIQQGYCCCCTPLKHGLSVANYWNDPNYQNSCCNCCGSGGYKYSAFLVKLNNPIEHNTKVKFIKNVTNVRKYLILESKNDPIVKPIKSQQFVTPITAKKMENALFINSKQYQKDLLGFKTLYDQGKRTKTLFKDGYKNCGDRIDIISFSFQHDGQWNTDARNLMMKAIANYATRIKNNL